MTKEQKLSLLAKNPMEVFVVTNRKDDMRYSLLCTPRKDGDGRKLASELRGRLKETIESFAVDRNADHSAIKLKSCRYLSDGEIRATFTMPDTMEFGFTEFLYDRADILDIDILEAGED